MCRLNLTRIHIHPPTYARTKLTHAHSHARILIPPIPDSTYVFVAPVIVDTGAKIVPATTTPTAATPATVAPVIMATVLALTMASDEELVGTIDSAVSEEFVCIVTGGRAVVETISSHRPPV